MFTRTKIYTVHENQNLPEPSERVEILREGFSVWAFALNLLWLLAQRLWVPFFIYLLLLAGLMEAKRRLGFEAMTLAVLQAMLQLLLGMCAHDLQRHALARRGYRLTGVVVAESALAAEQRAYQMVAA